MEIVSLIEGNLQISPLNGAEALIYTLSAGGVISCHSMMQASCALAFSRITALNRQVIYEIHTTPGIQRDLRICIVQSGEVAAYSTLTAFRCSSPKSPTDLGFLTLYQR